MQNKLNRGSWPRESRTVDAIQEKIRYYQDDIAKHYEPQTLIAFIDAKAKVLDNIELNIQAIKPTSFFYPRNVKLQAAINTVRHQLHDFKQHILDAERYANKLVLQYKQKTERLIKAYENMHPFEAIYLNNATANANQIKQRSVSYKLWYEAQKKLDYFRQIQTLNSRQHNALAQLLLADDRTFINNVYADTVVVEGEIGLLIIQRLQGIFYSAHTSASLKKMAIQKIKRSMASRTTDNLLFYNEAILHQELTKLYLHAALHPQQKFAWLGTARAVDATIENVRPSCIYFNPPRHFLTWGLNRRWLHAAVSLGYQFHLVEQHFPSIEKAILTQKPIKYIEQLLLETRDDSLKHTSQYNGNYSCTATNQEILALMDMGCTAYKDELDQSIRLVPPRTACEESLSMYASVTKLGTFAHCPVKRNHSTSDIQASAPPPYDDWNNHFTWN